MSILHLAKNKNALPEDEGEHQTCQTLAALRPVYFVLEAPYLT